MAGGRGWAVRWNMEELSAVRKKSEVPQNAWSHHECRPVRGKYFHRKDSRGQRKGKRPRQETTREKGRESSLKAEVENQ